MKGVVNILGIDPSFSRTGLSFYDSQGKCTTKSITKAGLNYKIDTCLQHAAEEARELQNFINSLDLEESINVIYEYPVMASRSGAYLAVLMAKFDSMLKSLGRKGLVKSIIYVPPTAVPAYTGILKKNKTEIVNYAKTLEEARFNHDEATAIILSKIGDDILKGKYHKSYFKVEL